MWHNDFSWWFFEKFHIYEFQYFAIGTMSPVVRMVKMLRVPPSKDSFFFSYQSYCYYLRGKRNDLLWFSRSIELTQTLYLALNTAAADAAANLFSIQKCLATKTAIQRSIQNSKWLSLDKSLCHHISHLIVWYANGIDFRGAFKA